MKVTESPDNKVTYFSSDDYHYTLVHLISALKEDSIVFCVPPEGGKITRIEKFKELAKILKENKPYVAEVIVEPSHEYVFTDNYSETIVSLSEKKSNKGCVDYVYYTFRPFERHPER